MNLSLPAVFSVDELTPARNRIQQIYESIRVVEGDLATFTRDKLHGHLLNPAAGGEAILIVPVKSKQVPDNYRYVIGIDTLPMAVTVDASKGTWMRHPLQATGTNPDGNEAAIQRTLESWDEAFSYVQEDQARNKIGLRSPQIGALHAIHAHWVLSDSTATIVMPTGTGKTETMLSILISVRCPRLLVVVPTDALRSQIADKFLTLGILKTVGSKVVTSSALHPIVCRLEHVPLNGSAQESVEMYDWRGCSSLSHSDTRSRRRCGNVETRVLCGFPSSEGGQNRCGRSSFIPPSERHFHSEAPVYRPFCRDCAVRRPMERK